MNERRRQRELMKLVERQRRWRPGDDEFDEQYRNWALMPGLAMIWIIVARTWRAIARRARKTPPNSPGQGPLPLQSAQDAMSQQSRRPLWTVGPKPLE